MNYKYSCIYESPMETNTYLPHFFDLNVSDSGKKLTVEIRDIDLSIVNSLRRCILSDVPCVAFDYRPTDPVDSGIQIHINTSPLHNEMIGHRLSMVPICMNEKQVAAFTRDPLLYGFKCRVKNTGREAIYVTSADIHVVDGRTGSTISKAIRDAFFPACPITKDHIVLVKLKPSLYGDDDGEELYFEAKAVVGTGSSHARWCPVSVSTFVNKIDEVACATAFDSMIANRQGQLSDTGQEQMTQTQIEEEKKKFYSLNASRVFLRDEYGDPRVFTFNVESEVGMSAPFIVFRAFEVLISMVDDLRSSMAQRLQSKVTSSICNGYCSFTIFGEGHTCGNMIQSHIYIEHFRKRSQEETGISYVAYFRPHPLENQIILRLKLKNPSADPFAFMVSSLQDLSTRLRAYALEWIGITKLKEETQGVEDIIHAFVSRISATHSTNPTIFSIPVGNYL